MKTHLAHKRINLPANDMIRMLRVAQLSNQDIHLVNETRMSQFHPMQEYDAVRSDNRTITLKLESSGMHTTLIGRQNCPVNNVRRNRTIYNGHYKYYNAFNDLYAIQSRKGLICAFVYDGLIFTSGAALTCYLILYTFRLGGWNVIQDTEIVRECIDRESIIAMGFEAERATIQMLNGSFT